MAAPRFGCNSEKLLKIILLRLYRCLVTRSVRRVRLRGRKQSADRVELRSAQAISSFRVRFGTPARRVITARGRTNEVHF